MKAQNEKENSLEMEKEKNRRIVEK